MADVHPLSSDALRIEVRDAAAHLTFDRPEVMNAFDRGQRLRLDAALKALQHDDRVRAIVLTGAVRAFCAGQDQHESAAMDAAASARRIDDYMALYRTIRAVAKPMIARIDGVAAGAGLQVALMCDLRIASTRARMGMTELKVGSVAVTGSFLLRERVGDAAMRRMVLLGEVLDAQRSLSEGLLHEVHAPEALDARIDEVCARLAELPALPVALTRRWWSAMSDELFERAAEAAKSGHAENFASGAYTAGAKRFTGRKGR